MGLPNNGYKYYTDAATNLKPKKPFFISVSGLKKEESLEILSEIQTNNMLSKENIGIELNLSCPNIIGKPQIAYDFDAMDETLRFAFEIFDSLSLGIHIILEENI